VPLDPVEVSDTVIGDESLSFDVDQVGVPVLVKMSYFPNWTARGADGPYRVAPNFMVVVPNDTHVELTYGRTEVEWLSYALTLAGIVGLVLLARRPRVQFSREHHAAGWGGDPYLDEPCLADYDAGDHDGEDAADAGDGDAGYVDTGTDDGDADTDDGDAGYVDTDADDSAEVDAEAALGRMGDAGGDAEARG
jgi:hypothetical protein